MHKCDFCGVLISDWIPTTGGKVRAAVAVEIPMPVRVSFGTEFSIVCGDCPLKDTERGCSYDWELSSLKRYYGPGPGCPRYADGMKMLDDIREEEK